MPSYARLGLRTGRREVTMEQNSAEVTDGDAPFAPHSPWSQPPIHRPAPRADPEPSKWTRRDVPSQRPPAPFPPLLPPPVPEPIAEPIPDAAPEPAQLYQPVNGGPLYAHGRHATPHADDPALHHDDR